MRGGLGDAQRGEVVGAFTFFRECEQALALALALALPLPLISKA
jgi:hypothetical protein